jgi:SNF2 domain-containing protein/SNF2 helicase protein/helicase-like protein
MPLDALPGQLQATFWPGGRVPSEGHLAWWGTNDARAAAVRLGLPPGEPAELPGVLPASAQARRRVAPAAIPARVVPIRPAVRALAALPPRSGLPSWPPPSDSLLAWSLAAKLALEYVCAGHLVPALRPAGPSRGIAYWRLSAGDGRLATLAEAMPAAAHALVRDDDPDAVWAADELLAAFGDAVADACARRAGATEPGAAWPDRFVAALTGDDPVVELADQALVEELARWSAPVVRGHGRAAAQLCLQLCKPDGEHGPWPLLYHLQAGDDPSLLVPAEQVWSSGAAGVRMLGRHLIDPQESLVRGLAEAARLFPPVAGSLSQQRPTGAALTADQAGDFLARGAAALAAAGLGVLLPAELTARGARKLRARLRVYARGMADPGAGITGSMFGAETLAEFRWEAAIGDAGLSTRELSELAELKRPLVWRRGEWLRLDAGEVPKLVVLAGRTGTLASVDALAMALAGRRETPELGEVEVVPEGPLADLVERLRRAGDNREPRLDGIDADLRDYQRRGVAWLQALSELGFGALLADDMGLGKTLQAIALLASRRDGRPHLVVCPTSVVGNWERELARFAPAVSVARYHGPERSAYGLDGLKPGTVAITSYGLLRRDAARLAEVDWDVVVLDEAQQIKNQAAQTARAAKRLPALARVALTGTPVENRLSELWSIMDFANPGLLGPFHRFRTRYAVPIERWQAADAATRLRQVTAPFMMRRMKTDPAVAADLPPKIESTVVCALTREQASLYQAATDALLNDVDELGSGIERRGRILKLLTALKQICNHPAQYLDEAGPLAGRSGKLARATEILAEVVDAGERALVFTQYREMGERLARHLAAALGLPGVPFLHGGVERTLRDEMVASFQAGGAESPILILSLRAGGTGLNLTRANHVVHYDRWWNPAVEDQATDRAYRIGQDRTVNVHKLVTGGTLEERIAELLERKRALASSVVGAGETWLTELGDADLRALVELSGSDVAEVDEQ